MSFQTRKTFVHLRSTNVFDAFWELSDPPIDSRDPTTIKVEVCAGLFLSPAPARFYPAPTRSRYTVYSVFVHPLSALNNFLPDPTDPAKFRSGFQNHTFKFPLLKESKI